MDPDGLVSPPARCPCGVGARATLLLAPLYVATSLGLSGPFPGPAGLIPGTPSEGRVYLKPPLAGLAVGGHLLHPLPVHRQMDEAWTFLNVAAARLPRRTPDPCKP